MRLPDKRRDQLLALLKQEKYHSIEELKKKTGIAHATLHRDLNALEAEGLIRKTYGGIELLSEKMPSREYDKRIGMNVERKEAIARKAATLVSPGDTIFLDGSSTAYYLGRALMDGNIEGVTIVTNSLHLLMEYRDSDTKVRLLSTGGSVDRELNAFLGEMSVEFISRIRIDKTFVSSAGWSVGKGITTTSDFILGVLRAAIAAADKKYCLIDSSKFGRDYIFRIAPLNAFDAIVTDSGAGRNAGVVESEAGVGVVVAD